MTPAEAAAYRAGIDRAARECESTKVRVDGSYQLTGVSHSHAALDCAAAAIRALPVPSGGEAEVSVEVDPAAFEHWWQTRQPPDLRAVAIKADLVIVSGGMLFLTPAGRKLRRRGEALRAARGQP